MTSKMVVGRAEKILFMGGAWDAATTDAQTSKTTAPCRLASACLAQEAG